MTADGQEHDVKEIVANSPWFEGLPDEAHQALATGAKIRSYRKNSYIFTIGETSSDVYCVLSGRVRLLLTSALGQEYAITDLEPGSWTGEQVLAGDQPRMLDAQIVDDAAILVIPRATVFTVGEKHPQLYQKIFNHHILRSRGIYLLLLGMAFYPLRSRLAGRFLALIEEHGRKDDQGIYLDVQLSQNDFAQLSLGSRQRINKILSDWRKRGVLELQSNRYLIRDMDALIAETELRDSDK